MFSNVYSDRETPACLLIHPNAQKAFVLYGQVAEQANKTIVSQVSYYNLWHPVYTERETSIKLREEVITTFEQVALLWKQLDITSLKEVRAGIRDSGTLLSSHFAFNTVHGIRKLRDYTLLAEEAFGVNGNFLIGVSGGFSLVMEDSRGQKFILSLDSSFCKNVGANIWIVGYDSLAQEGSKFITRICEANGSYILEPVGKSYYSSDSFILRIAQALAPQGVTHLISSCIVLVNQLSTTKEVEGLIQLNINNNLEFRVDSRYIMRSGSHLMNNLMKRSASVYYHLTSNGAASTGLSNAAADMSKGAMEATKKNILLTSTNLSSSFGKVAILNALEQVYTDGRAKIETEDELDDVAIAATEAVMADEGVQGVLITQESIQALAKVFAVDYARIALAHSVREKGTNAVVNFWPSSRMKGVLNYLDVDTTESALDSEQSYVMLVDIPTSSNLSTVNALIDDYKNTHQTLEKMIAKIDDQLESFDVEALNKQYRAAQGRYETALDAQATLLSAQLHVDASAAAVIKELTKVLQTPVILGPYGQVAGVVEDYLNINYSTKTPSLKSNYLSLLSQNAGNNLLSSTRVKASWTVYPGYKGDVNGVSAWSNKETQERRSSSINFGSEGHKSNHVRYGYEYYKNLKAFGMISPTVVSVEIAALQTRKQGSKTITVVPRIVRQFVGNTAYNFLHGSGLVIQAYLRSDALKSYAAVRESLDHVKEAVFKYKRELNELLNDLNTYEELMLKRAELRREQAQVEDLLKLNPDKLFASPISKSNDALPQEIVDLQLTLTDSTKKLIDLSMYSLNISGGDVKIDEKYILAVKDKAYLMQELVRWENSYADKTTGLANYTERNSRWDYGREDVALHVNLDDDYQWIIPNKTEADLLELPALILKLKRDCSRESARRDWKLWLIGFPLRKLREKTQKIYDLIERNWIEFRRTLRFSVNFSSVGEIPIPAFLSDEAVDDTIRDYFTQVENYIDSEQPIVQLTVPEGFVYVEHRMEELGVDIAFLVRLKRKLRTKDSKRTLEALELYPINMRSALVPPERIMVTLPGYRQSLQGFIHLLYSYGTYSIPKAALVNILYACGCNDISRFPHVIDQLKLTERERAFIKSMLEGFKEGTIDKNLANSTVTGNPWLAPLAFLTLDLSGTAELVTHTSLGELSSLHSLTDNRSLSHVILGG